MKCNNPACDEEATFETIDANLVCVAAICLMCAVKLILSSTEPMPDVREDA